MKNTTKIGVVLVIGIMFFAAEIVVGFKTKSLALIADAFHYLNDIVAYAIAFVAAYLQERGQHTHSFTYAFHRAELVGAFFNGVFLLALALSILLQSIERFVHVQEVQSPKLVLITGGVGLALNILSAIVVHDHHHHHGHGHTTAISSESMELPEISGRYKDHIHATHNHRLDPPVSAPQHNLGLLGVLVHLLGDAINNIGVMIAAVIMMKVHSPQRFYADPAFSLFISLIIGASAIPMTYKSGRILLESSPIHLDLSKVKEDLLSVGPFSFSHPVSLQNTETYAPPQIPDVVSVHDLHVWHLSQSVLLGSLHVCVPLGTSLEQWEQTERYLQHCFEEYGIRHVTISPEIYRDSQTLTQASEDSMVQVGGCRLPSHDDFGCAVSDMLKKRKAASTPA
ncbi:CDF zinc transporter [Crepidotus variabilis]|uniref:CDF zinc transporter n=1 Tax=Crepidotus variabilis TaxID=179855 RepID=A0A9P6EIT0_9AGAR|nr:CDF zinc transporter [Crepidotus variabilis]